MLSQMMWRGPLQRRVKRRGIYCLLAGIALSIGAGVGCEAPAAKPSPATSTTQPSPAAQSSLDRYEYTAPKMGTIFHLVLYAPDKALADRAADAAWARVDELNAALSDYDPKSEISRLGQMTLDGPMKAPVAVASGDLLTLLERSIDAGQQSDGAFDITVGPLVQLWRRSRQLEILPTPARVAEAKKSVGYQHIELFSDPPGVQLTAAKMRLDVGGIAKGYTAMQIRQLLKEKFGITRVFCGAAGDIAVGDPPPGKAGWVIALESLDKKTDSRAAYVLLANYGISTSGDTERFVIIDGKRYSHIIDPQTGLGLTDRIGVTVIAPDATTTDWMSTAVSIMGPEKGLKLVERTPGAAARITKAEADGIHVWESTRFSQFAVHPQN